MERLLLFGRERVGFRNKKGCNLPTIFVAEGVDGDKTTIALFYTGVSANPHFYTL